MSGKRIAGIVCFLLSVALVISGIRTLMSGPEVTDASGVGVSHAVGAFLPALIVLIIGLWLFKKPPE